MTIENNHNPKFSEWLDQNKKYTEPMDMDAWLAAAWNAGADSLRQEAINQLLSMPSLMHACDALGVRSDGSNCAKLRSALLRESQDENEPFEPVIEGRLRGWDGKTPIDRYGNPLDPEKFGVVVIDSAVKE